ncbi:MAG: lysyl oxidase family protein [Longimicrobiaceae bacterium]
MNGRKILAVLAAGLALTACESSQNALSAPDQPRALFGPQDLVGSPDLVVDAAKLASSWVISTEYLPATLCSVQEGDVPPGTRRLLRFTVTTPNVGDADVFIGDPRAHIDPNGDGNYADSDGLFNFAPCHHHFHFNNYATYEMFPLNANGTLGPAVKARKRGFCMIDTTPYTSSTPAKEKVYYSCGTPESAGNQGISTGWADTYVKQLAGQYFVLDDPNEPVPAGRYVLRITVNPGFTPAKGEPCPALDPTGKCHNFAESNYTNNVGQVTIDIPADRNGKTGGAVKTAEDGIDDEQRPTN